MPPLFDAAGVTAGYPGHAPIFRDFSFTIRPGETWAVTGPGAAGKTSLARLVRGLLPARAGALRWPGLDTARVRVVGFRSDSRTLDNRQHYYQERFQASDPVTTPTVRAYLADGRDVDPAKLLARVEQLRLLPHLDARVVTLSTGQTRRAQVARALTHDPGLVILDDPFAGLDADSADLLSRLVGEVIARGTPVLLLARPGPLPGWVTHRLDLPGASADAGEIGSVTPPREFGEPVIECANVTVRHGGVAILDGVNWVVRAGERWGVAGANGAGKSTLLSLIAGDHPQAFAQNLRLFGRRRGDGTLAEWKARVGLASSEMHQYYREPLTLRQTVLTGFTEGLAPRRFTASEQARADELLAAFRLGDAASRPFRTLSAGQQRLGLVARALARDPDLVILDEPFAPLDAQAARHARVWLDAHLAPRQTLLFVGHQRGDWPRTLTHELHLVAGKVSASGPAGAGKG